ncbi:sensor histidine kinase [Oceanobacillus halophilus]|uniref:histidine kinase n=1 Tax=Oceanobacillus halophilus TaxID=930130 RepID=A0A494ZWX9_9BACI|nr:ATP-binding protein [Oceanobacillus halophilus]RKQ30911.1 sensor histidine kinase [Oceanobacillus halophilus]
MKLKTKIQVFSSVFMLVLVLMANTSIYFFFYKMSANTELEELEVVTNDVIKALNDNPTIDPGDLLKAYLPANGMIRVVLESEVAMLESMRSEDYRALGWEFSQSESKEIVSKKDAPDIAVIQKPMIWATGNHKGEIVTIQVSNHMVSLHETMNTLLYVLGILSIIMLIPVIIASSVLSQFLLKPIQNLIKTMKGNTQQGNWQKINVENRTHDEIYEMEKTFNEMIDYLKTSYEKQEMFVSDASHELKTPIQIIKSYAQLLERRGTANPEVTKESIEAIDTEAERMKKLVEQMLSLAKNQQINYSEKVNVKEIIEETVSMFRGIHDRDLKLIMDNSDLVIPGNSDQLEQVIYILIDNAIKYSKEAIEIQAYQQDDYAVFRVKDYGQGISKEEQERIFDRFYRVDKARSRDTGGTGLGLAIAKSIAESHGGSLSVESKLGEGSTFTLRLSLI